MSVMQLPEKHDHQLSGGVSKEQQRPMTMLSEDDVSRVDQQPDAGHQPRRQEQVIGHINEVTLSMPGPVNTWMVTIYGRVNCRGNSH